MTYRIDGTTVVLTPHAERILRAQLLDGADTATVARRAGVSQPVANRVLSDIARTFEMSRLEMVVAFLRGRIQYKTRVHGWGERREAEREADAA